MSWEKIQESNKDFPEEIFAKRISGFSNATTGLAELIIVPVKNLEIFNSRLETDFIFRLFLTSPQLKEYKFKILEFGYEVTLDPVHIELEESIYDEIYEDRHIYNRNIRKIPNQGLDEEIQKIFASKVFLDLVSGLMKIARKSLAN